MRFKIIVLFVFASLFLVACGKESDTNEGESNNDIEIKELVHDYTIGKAEAASASITSSELIVTDDNNNEEVYKLPKDEFFVSIAPYINESHPCDIHSLTTCQGELVNEEFQVHIEDASGNIVLDEIKQTEANGFIDLWLPRNDTFTVTITQDNKETSQEITTFEGDNTCITTMQLS